MKINHGEGISFTMIFLAIDQGDQ